LSVLSALIAAPTTVPRFDDEDEKLPTGLVVAYRDADRSEGAEVWRVEPTIAFSLRAGESPHPRISDQAWSAQWQGQIQTFRAGRYRFSAELIGQATIRVAGQVVLTARIESNQAELAIGPEVELPAGLSSIEADFSKKDGPASLRVFWQSSSFSSEPLRWDVLHYSATDAAPQLIESMRQDRGRFLVEELGCAACHRPANGDTLAQRLDRRQGPDLSRIGERAFPGWIYQWLANPQSFRPQAVMPQMFADDETGRVERYAVATYLASLGGPPRRPKQELSREEVRNFRRRGERLFSRIGCSVCHLPSEGKNAIADLKHLGSKTTPDRLAQFLQNPLSINPSGRMPQMGLDGGEARDLAYFLCESIDEHCLPDLPLLSATASTQAIQTVLKQVTGSSDEADRLAHAPDSEKLRLTGERLVVKKGCTNCHRVAPAGNELPVGYTLASLAHMRDEETQSRGCLRVQVASVTADIPRFVLTDEHRECIAAFLTSASTGAGSVAPGFSAQVTLRRLQCVACHSRAGQGGLGPDRVEELRKYESAQDAEAIQPPPLTNVGAKLRTNWLSAVLTQGRRARPWMALRMPQFGQANVAKLAEQLAAADGVEPSDKIAQFEYDVSHVESGRLLVGKNGFGCISCHDIAGQPNTGTRGPDLASMNERVRYDWYSRWLDDPQRMQPGTRMPTVFQNGSTAIKTILGGDARAQSQAIWEYLSLGANLPLPVGLEPPRGLILEAKDRPMLVRSFLPDAGSHGIAIGFPNGISFAFDPAQGRLAYAWTGQFIDAGPIWQDRGGSPAGIRGPRYWTAPPGCPWELTDSPGSVPDWSKRLTDPARGARVREGELFDGAIRMQFRDYKIAKDGSPSLHYSLDPAVNGSERCRLEIFERFEPIQKLAGVGLKRSFHLQSERANTAWLLVAETNGTLQIRDASGDPIDTPSNAERTEYPAMDKSVIVTSQSGVQLFTVLTAPADARWSIVESSGLSRIALLIPIVGLQPNDVVIAVLCPYRNEPAMIRALLSGVTAP
jgi:cbb3-type cytochrome oxidase cytochrome c subunit